MDGSLFLAGCFSPNTLGKESFDLFLHCVGEVVVWGQVFLEVFDCTHCEQWLTLLM